MPEMTPTAMPGAKPPTQPGQPQQPPFGSTPATGPTPNKGYEAAGLQRLGVVLRQLEELVPLLGSASEPGKAVLDAIGKLSKHVPAGSVTPAAMKGNIESMAMRNAQQNQQMQALKPQGGAPAPGGAPPPTQAAAA